MGKLKIAVAAKPNGEKVSWDEPVADLALLMQQVPIVNDRLRRGMTDNAVSPATLRKLLVVPLPWP